MRLWRSSSLHLIILGYNHVHDMNYTIIMLNELFSDFKMISTRVTAWIVHVSTLSCMLMLSNMFDWVTCAKFLPSVIRSESPWKSWTVSCFVQCSSVISSPPFLVLHSMDKYISLVSCRIVVFIICTIMFLFNDINLLVCFCIITSSSFTKVSNPSDACEIRQIRCYALWFIYHTYQCR